MKETKELFKNQIEKLKIFNVHLFLITCHKVEIQLINLKIVKRILL